MLGAIIGDMAGTKFEYQEFLDSRKEIINIERRRSILGVNEDLITSDSFVSDDSILTIAIAEAIIYGRDYMEALKKYGKEYGSKPLEKENFFKSAFSPNFIKWANSNDFKCGTSIGNGAAMRVSPVAYLFNSLERVQLEAKKSAIPSHNTDEAIRGAESLASVIFLARNKKSKEDIKNYITEKYGYSLEYNLEKLQETNIFNGTCNVTVPQAIFIFLNSTSFEDSIRNAISIGGDTDTIACMVGSISEAYYGIPKDLRNKALSIIPEQFKYILVEAYKLKNKNESIKYCDKKDDIIK